MTDLIGTEIKVSVQPNHRMLLVIIPERRESSSQLNSPKSLSIRLSPSLVLREKRPVNRRKWRVVADREL